VTGRSINGIRVTGRRAYNSHSMRLLSWTISKCEDCGRFLKNYNGRTHCRECSVKNKRNRSRDYHREYDKTDNAKKQRKIRLSLHVGELR